MIGEFANGGTWPTGLAHSWCRVNGGWLRAEEDAAFVARVVFADNDDLFKACATSLVRAEERERIVQTRFKVMTKRDRADDWRQVLEARTVGRPGGSYTRFGRSVAAGDVKGGAVAACGVGVNGQGAGSPGRVRRDDCQECMAGVAQRPDS